MPLRNTTFESDQLDKFKEAARKHEMDEDNARWEVRFRNVAKDKPENVK